MNQCKISIIVPIYNVEKYLCKCLDSLVNQTMKEIEIILVNDASPDNSKNIMEEYQERYPDRIRCLYQKENQGQGAARNRGIDIAKGEYILFVDSDDYVDTRICEKLYEVVKNKSSDVVCCEYYEIKEDGKCSEISGYATQAMGELDDQKRRLLISSLSLHPFAKLIRKKILLEHQLYFQTRVKCGEDYAVISLLWMYTTRIDEVKEPLYYYYRHDNSATMMRNNPHYYDVYKVGLSICEELKKRKLEKEYVNFKEDILVRSFIEEVKFLIHYVDKPNIEELKLLRASVQKNISWYSKCLTAYMRNDPRAIQGADMLMESIDGFVNLLMQKQLLKKNYVGYYEQCCEKIESLLDYCKRKNYVTAIWGAGEKGTNFLSVCDPNSIKVNWVIDKNQKRWGTKLETGHRIESFDCVKEKVDVIIVMNRVYFGGIYRKVKNISRKIKVVNLDIYLLTDSSENIEIYME